MVKNKSKRLWSKEEITGLRVGFLKVREIPAHGAGLKITDGRDDRSLRGLMEWEGPRGFTG